MNLEIFRTFIPHPEHPDKKIEFFWNKPVHSKKCGAVILIHGHHPTLRMGARNDIASGAFEYFADNGLVCVSMSQPGYGRSDGPPDYCGPSSQAATRSIIDYLETLPFVDSSKIALFGWSRGSNVAGMVAATDRRVRVAILGGGLHDMVNGHEKFSENIKTSLSIESDGTKEALIARSPLHHIEKIKASTLLIHGEKDEVAEFFYAQEMQRLSEVHGLDFTLTSFKDGGHEACAYHVKLEVVAKFLEKHEFICEPFVEYGLNRME